MTRSRTQSTTVPVEKTPPRTHTPVQPPRTQTADVSADPTAPPTKNVVRKAELIRLRASGRSA
ncbi:hypothetical protein [Actinomadura rudentiformis]|uniref:hypothetical protein n=1 Tax=Actinomadura rudentiformis TaxID=359158 RepID=UPI00178C7300|nr:hypothetical protein [Actinomadura rudentiformis]